MRSRVEIVAELSASGTTALVRLRAEGQLAVRATGPGRVHLVGTAAGPLGGDELEVLVRVGAGAHLAVHGVAASLALPGAGGSPARALTRLDVGDGASLHYAPGPLVVCRGARLRTSTVIALAGSGRADVTEQVVLGRFGEPGGDWTGRVVADRDGHPLLRTTQDSALLATARVPPDERPVRAVVTRLELDDGTDVGPGAATTGGAVRCPLAGGCLLVTALGGDLSTALRDVAALAGRADLADPDAGLP